MNMKKMAVLLAALVLAVSLPAYAQERTFTDSLGRSVTLPQKVEKVAVSGPLAQMVVFPLAADELVGIAEEWNATAALYLSERYYNMPVLGQLYGGKGEMNLEELLLAAPDVVIDVGEPKDGMAQELDALCEQTGIPFVHIDASTQTMGDTYRLLGELLSLPEAAETLASYCDRIYAMAVELMEKVGENRVTALYLTGTEGLNVIARGSYHSEVIDLMTENLAVVDSPSSKGTGNETDMEQLLVWNPEVILFSPDSAYETAGSDALWLGLDAIASGRYYLVPFGPYNWLGFPPSVQRYLGILWLGDLLYPEYTDYDLYESVHEYYELFYRCDLTREQFDALVGR